MKYLINWISKTLNPEKHVKSLSTTSEYFYIHGAKIRIADHIGKDDNDLQIIIVKDLLGENKHYLIKDAQFPRYVCIPDVKTVKIVLTTFLFHFKNIDDTRKVQKNELVTYDVNDVKKTATATDTSILAEQDKTFNMCVSKLQNGITPTNEESSAFGTYMTKTFPQWKYFSTGLKKLFKSVLSYDKTFNDLVKIINTEFPANTNEWLTITEEDRKARLAKYVSDITLVKAEEGGIVVFDHPNYALTDEAYKNISSKPKTYLKQMNGLNELYYGGINTLSASKVTKLKSYLGSLFSVDTEYYKFASDGQKERFRTIIRENIPYDIVCNFINKTMSLDPGNNLIPEISLLDKYMKTFLKMYKAGIISYPGEKDFNDVFTCVKTCDTLKSESEQVIEDTVVTEPIPPVVENNIINSKTVEELVKESVESPVVTPEVKPTEIHISETYEYTPSDTISISNVPLFEENQINIIRDVINSINDKQKSTSFETKRLLDIFAKHYSDIWSRLTNTQRELCTSIITEEHMNIYETDYVINKLFNKNVFNWPVTELCRKYITEYCRRIRELRMAA